ncbi:phenylacetic acid degradation protein PaaY [Klebsiella pneumoniae]|uniref:Phenylacetic acid degradation protein PaaY n=1 Tax=Klebsiella pneumoniae TaxID=573 RepID=A0A378F4U9_KLEPN|nr:phenylacetic acid degradation protein PaaY [Klebsiella pneumoniae]
MIGRNALVGMSAVIIDGAVIGENSIVGASAFVKANAEMPANHLIIGSPAKAIRTLSEQELAWKKQGTREYQAWWNAVSRRCTRWSHYGKSKQGVSGWRLMKTYGQKPQPEG